METINFIGNNIEMNTNATILGAIMWIFIIPIALFMLVRYAKVIITGKDFKIFYRK